MSRVPVILALTALTIFIALTGCSRFENSPTSLHGDTAKTHGSRGTVVVANRGSGDISVIDARSGELRGTFMLPQGAGDNPPEPMYVNASAVMQRVFVGDRANDRVAVFDARTFEVVGIVPAGRGVFHQWVDRQGQRLWVNNDIDNTITVIDVLHLSVIATIDIPADLVAMGGKPHDVVVDHEGRYAYVTVLGIAGPNDYLLQFDAVTRTEMNRRPVGKDPHLGLGRNSDLYVPAQNSDEVRVFDPETLDQLETIAAPGAHGAAISPNGRFFYTTNLPGGGAAGLLAISTIDNTAVGPALDTPFAVPHNLALNSDGRLLFVTHSGGASDKVSIYRVDPATGRPAFHSDVTVGLNPFGIGYVP